MILKKIIFIIAIPLLTFPLTVRGVNIWKGTSGKNAKGEDVTCNESVIGCTFADAIEVVKNIINFLFVIAAPIAAAMIVYGAIVLMTSGGSSEKTGKAKDTLRLAIIGFAIIVAAAAIVNLITAMLSSVSTT
tara:strand:- start:122 stop:517 length:396 start_codon:yes stop_codon:yes gene_type:complete